MVEGRSYHNLDCRIDLSVHDPTRSWAITAAGKDSFSHDHRQWLLVVVFVADYNHDRYHRYPLEKGQKA